MRRKISLIELNAIIERGIMKLSKQQAILASGSQKENPQIVAILRENSGKLDVLGAIQDYIIQRNPTSIKIICD